MCGSLGIDAKSHSSSLVEAQADRVRRKAESEGLLKEQAVVEQVQDKSSSENEWNGKENSGESKKPPD